MRTYAPVNYTPPKAHTLCGQAWSYFANAAAAGTPVQSNQLAAIAAQTGFNLGNLKIELSRYNRYTASAAAGTLVTPPTRAPRTAAVRVAASTASANQWVQQQAIELRAAQAAAAPALLLGYTPAQTSKKGNRKAH